MASHPRFKVIFDRIGKAQQHARKEGDKKKKMSDGDDDESHLSAEIPKNHGERRLSRGLAIKRVPVIETPATEVTVDEASNELKLNQIIDFARPTTGLTPEPRVMDNDPFQLFEVSVEQCHLLIVNVIEGRNISKGSINDLIDVPDPYVVVHIRAAPDGKKQTRSIDNETNPKWKEVLEYYLPPDEAIATVAQITLMDANYTFDEPIGQVEYDVGKVEMNQVVRKTFIFNETSEVDIEFKRVINKKYNLRSSLALCGGEKTFRKSRKRVVQANMREIMELGAPRNLRETPTIAIMGSGGGYRALVGYSGAVRALKEMGIFDCASYIVGLSGSTWYMSSLYSHPSFPEEGVWPATEDMRKSISTNLIRLVHPHSLMRYGNRLRTKMRSGQPVTFTDFFGLLIGEHLLGPERMETACLSDFQKKIEDGKAPMPLMTCLHVRSDVSAMVYHEWIEFSPYEIGMAKYGTFVRTSDFNNKFFMGVISKNFHEAPLHFLMGVWGSAFSILFNRLVAKTKPNESGKKQDEEAINILRNNDIPVKMTDSDDSDEEIDDLIAEDEKPEEKEEEKNTTSNENSSSTTTWGGYFKGMLGFGSKTQPPPKTEPAAPSQPSESEPKTNAIGEEAPGPSSMLDSFIQNVLQAKLFRSREYRAGKILNYMRGLSLNVCYPISPFTPTEKECFFKKQESTKKNEPFDRVFEPISAQKKKVFVVDAGLTFNSPYPAILRPQRTVDLIISFDFSARPTDDSQPFKELLLAEKWARLHNLPFPKIDPTVFEREGMKECYVFKDESDDRAPIILHFVLCNVNFRKYSSPGVERDAEDKCGDFDLFSEGTPYSTFNFHYEKKNFDRLHNLMRFNTLLHKQTILDNIAECVNLRRHCHTRCTVSLKEIRNSVYLSEEKKQELSDRINKTGLKAIFLDS